MSANQTALSHQSVPSAAERVFSLLELFEPVLQDLPIQDLITAAHVSRAFSNNISSSKLLRQRILDWRNMSLNELVLQDTQSIPTGTVGSRDFDYPYLRTKQPAWLFHTECEDAILITYRCHRPQPRIKTKNSNSNIDTDNSHRKEEYFLYIPLSPTLPIHTLHLSNLTISHSTYTFTATWTSNSRPNSNSIPFLTQSFSSALLTYVIRQPRPLHQDPTHMYTYLQTWYASSPADISINWKAWAEHEWKLNPPDEDGDQRTWLQWKMRAVGKMRKEGTKARREEDVEVLDVRGTNRECFHVAADLTFKPRHGHIRDGSQTDLALNLQATNVKWYGKSVRLTTRSSDPQTLKPAGNVANAQTSTGNLLAGG
ncbi:hypothetical protein Slin15195_G075040 [Septoria linicola]|uniref:F-box domain-containing protein n=1 Tax=Septoria linicola TaxID=215465 RepID=A0A9Q9ASA2_9PEZI|nr:hypothetical protein Slin15195_G075040 [Septoria linicola]